MSNFGVKIDTTKNYDIKAISIFTGYSTEYLRNLERAGKIPTAKRDSKKWRYWTGNDLVKILEFRNRKTSKCWEGKQR